MRRRPRHDNAWIAWAIVVCVVVLGWSPIGELRAEDNPIEMFSPGGMAGVGMYAPYQWGMVNFTLRNRTDKPVTLLATVYFGNDSNTQYARSITVPARADMVTLCPVRPGSSENQPLNAFDTQSLLLKGEGENQTAITTTLGQMRHAGMLLRDEDPPRTAVLSDNDDDSTGDLVQAMRTGIGLTRRAAVVTPYIPTITQAWEVIDSVVLSGGVMERDSQAEVKQDTPMRPVSRFGPVELEALRGWLYSGGKLMVMLETLDESFMKRLLGDDWPITELDRTSLTSITVEGPGAEGTTQEYEEPIGFVRVLCGDMHVIQTVNGYPATMEKSVGRGKLIVVTLGSRAWYRRRVKADPVPEDSMRSAGVVSYSHLNELGGHFIERPGWSAPHKNEQAAAGLEAVSQSLVTEQIGSKILGRNTTLTVLAVFCGVLLVGGLVLAKRDSLDKMGIAVPVASVVGAVVLLSLGSISRSAAPPTASWFQRLDVDPSTGQAQLRGLLGVYLHDASDRFGADHATTLWLGDDRGGGSVKRMVWTDYDKWHWEGLSFEPAVVHLASVESHRMLDRPIRASVSFNENGVVGSLDAGDLQNVSSPLLAGPGDGMAAPVLEGSLSFTADAQRSLSPGQYLVAGVLSDTQLRQQRAMDAVFGGAKRYRPKLPTLVFWADPLVGGIELPGGLQTQGQVMVSLPVDIVRPPAGQTIHISSLFLPYEVTRREGGPRGVIAYDTMRKEWIPVNTPATVPLRFQLPAALLPLRLLRGELNVQIHALGRTVGVLHQNGGKRVELDRAQSPSTWANFKLQDPGALTLDGRGGLTLLLDVGEASDASNFDQMAPQWQVGEVRLSLDAVVEKAPDPRPESNDKSKGADHAP
ncbi:MAG: hypothetical protein GC164_16340 [Phycisphaera sp.]|nr:hypothetical protein [Phycisphaera sp.]